MKLPSHFFAWKKNFLLFFFVMCALNAAFFFLALVPFYEKIQSLGNDISAAQGKITRFDQQKERFAEVEHILASEGTTFKRIEATVLDINSPLPFIELIEELGREQGVDAKIVVRDVPKDGLQKFQILAEGEFPKLFQYLRILEFLPYQVRFLSIQITSSEMRVIQEESSVSGQKDQEKATQRTVSKMALDIAVRVKN